MISKTHQGFVTAAARLETDEQSARKIAAAFDQSLGNDDIAVSLVDSGRGRWEVAIHFPASGSKTAVRGLVATAAGAAAAKALIFVRLAAKDWVRDSLAGLSPVRAGRFVVHGTHDRARIPINSIGIEIEGSLAFGTGHHGTTRGCLLALDWICKTPNKHRATFVQHHPEVRAKRASTDDGRGVRSVALRGSLRGDEHLGVTDNRVQILDLGAGSGVLAIAVARALRQRVLATDVDSEAVRAARENARLNSVGALIEVAKTDGVSRQCVRARAPFDLVFANILLRPLQRFAAPLRQLIRPGGRIILSGILRSQASAALSGYRPLALERRIDLDGWTTLVLTRRVRPRPAVARRRRHP